MQKNFNSLPVFNRKRALSALLSLLLVCSHPAQAQIKNIMDSNLGPSMQSNGKQAEWIPFPYSIQVNPYLGITDDISELDIKGVNIAVEALQINKFIHKHFNVYPKLGLAFNYAWLGDQGSLIGGLIYLEPQYNYLAKWEIFPRLSIGVANVIYEQEVLQGNNEEAAFLDTDSTQASYEEHLYWDLSLALVARIGITPHWQFSPSIGFSYLPALGDDDDEEQEATPLKSFITASIALSYTPNPGLIRYPSWGDNKRSNVNIGWLSTIKPSHSTQKSISTTQLKENEEEETTYHYVGGIYGQWSIQLFSNHALTFATEWILDKSIEHAIKNRVMNSPLKISILGGHEFRWGELLFGQQVGFYIKDDEKIFTDSKIYANFTLDYKITDSLLLGVGLRMNEFLALEQEEEPTPTDLSIDSVDFRISYSF